MTNDSTPRHDLTPEELETSLRDSHVAIKETLRARGELEPDDEAAAAPPRLRLVTKAAADVTVEDDRAKLVELRAPGRGLVDAERLSAGDGTEAKFHRRREIARAVQAARESRRAPALGAPSPAPSLLRRALWFAGGVAVAVSLAFGVGLAWPSSSPRQPPPDVAAGTLPLPLSAVTLDLRGVPEGATIRLDGAPVQGPAVAVEADGQAHTLSVDAAGYRHWSVTLVPAVDRAIPVDLVARPDARDRR